MRTVVLVLLALLGTAKGIGFAVAPDAMATLTPTGEPSSRLAVCAAAGGTAALLFFAAAAARAPALVRAVAAYAAMAAAFALLAPSSLWEACMAFVHSVMLDHPAVPATASIAVSVLLLWTAGPPRRAQCEQGPYGDRPSPVRSACLHGLP